MRRFLYFHSDLTSTSEDNKYNIFSVGQHYQIKRYDMEVSGVCLLSCVVLCTSFFKEVIDLYATVLYTKT